jgi:hypothetical protein
MDDEAESEDEDGGVVARCKTVASEAVGVVVGGILDAL